MKKNVFKTCFIALIALALTAIALVVCAHTASAERSGDWEYTVLDGEAKVSRYYGSKTDVTIPSEIDGYPVTGLISYYDYGYSGFRGIFYGKNVTALTIPDSVTSIGSNAFAFCYSLKSVTIPDSVTRIVDYAFYYCSSLTSVMIPDTVTSVGSYAFWHCSSLKSVTIPDSVTSIESYTFEGCTSLSSVTIPVHVRSIGNYAFSGCTFLKNVTIPDSVTMISEGAFSGCTRLTSVTIGDSVTSIGDSAFYKCSALTSVTIPDSVTSIGSLAFLDCSSLTSVMIPDSVTSIGNSAFDYCTSLSRVDITDIAAWCGIYFGDNPLEYAQNLYLNGELVTDLVIPDSVTSIGNSAFSYCTSLTSVTIPDSVTSIGSYAFKNCTSLSSVTIPDSVTSIGGAAFAVCSSLSSVTIPDSVTSIGWNAFAVCSSLSSVTIPDSVTSIGDFAFEYCRSLTIVTLPNSVTSIGVCAFDGCTSLSSVTIPDSVTSIGSGAFRNCTSLTNVTLPDSVTKIVSGVFEDCTSLTNITLPDSATSIGDSAFEGCTSLLSVTIPDSVTRIGSSAFSGCHSPLFVGYGGDSYGWGLISIASSNYNLTGGILYNALSCNESNGFSYFLMKNGTSMLVNYSGEDEEVIIPSEFEGYPLSVIYRSFEGHDTITSVTIPDSVTSIGSYAFKNCTSLSSVTIPDSVTSIGGAAFDGCTSLKKVYYPGTELEWSGKVSVGNYNEYLRNAEFVFGYHEPVPKYVARNAATCTEDGNIGYWYCTVCGIFYSDAECENEIDASQVVIPSLGHSFGSDDNAEKCSVCGEKNPNYKPPVSFKDVKPGAYYADAVAWAVANNITAGTSSTTFSPDDGCTRGQVVTFLWRAAGQPEPKITFNPFKDVKTDAYYYKAVLWAIENGITNGTSSNTFSPNATCTRGQIVTFLWRANDKPTPTKQSNPFMDVKSSDYFYDAVLWAVGKKITLGTDETHFSPNSTCTRGQVVTFLYRAMK